MRERPTYKGQRKPCAPCSDPPKCTGAPSCVISPFGSGGQFFSHSAAQVLPTPSRKPSSPCPALLPFLGPWGVSVGVGLATGAPCFSSGSVWSGSWPSALTVGPAANSFGGPGMRGRSLEPHSTTLMLVSARPSHTPGIGVKPMSCAPAAVGSGTAGQQAEPVTGGSTPPVASEWFL